MTATRFEISCIVTSEAALGAIIARMKEQHAEAIGFDIMGDPASASTPDGPNGVKLLSTTYRQSPKGKGHKTARALIDSFIMSQDVGSEFRAGQVQAFLNMRGRSGGITLQPWVDQGVLQKVTTGIYRRMR
jgi:hypothetical protein